MTYGTGPYGLFPFGSGFSTFPRSVPLSLAGIVVAIEKVQEGTLIKSTASVWSEIARRLNGNWSLAYEIPPDKWEEIIAGAFDKAGYDEVTLTPRSGDHGRDVIAIRKGVGSIKIIGSVKAYADDNLVGYAEIRALLGVLSGERDASKGIITTTSGFPPKVMNDPYIAPFVPTRLETCGWGKASEVAGGTGLWVSQHNWFRTCGPAVVNVPRTNKEGGIAAALLGSIRPPVYSAPAALT